MDFIKNELIECIQGLTNENLEQTKERIDKIFGFIEVSQSIWGEVPHFKVEEKIEKINNDKEIASQIKPSNVTISNEKLEMMKKTLENKEEFPEETSALTPAPLERRLKGGILKINEKTIFVPEKVIRTEGFVHGDYLIANGTDEKNLTFVKHADSTTESNSNRTEKDYCLVGINEQKELFITHQVINGEIQELEINGKPRKLKVSPQNATGFNLKEGDLIRIAFYDTRPEEFRIIWVYMDTPFREVKTPAKPSKAYKDSSNIDKKPIWNEEEATILSGKKIALIGADFRVSDFIPLSQEGNFFFRCLSGDENEHRFEAAVKNKDLIISLSEHSSHRSSELAKSLAKKYNIPFRAAPTSLSSIKRAVSHGIKETEIPFYSFF